MSLYIWYVRNPVFALEIRHEESSQFRLDIDWDQKYKSLAIR